MNTLATIGGVTPPDSALTRKAVSLAERVHTKVLLNHVHRTWWFAEHIAKRQGLVYDRELVYLAAILHDLSLSDEFAADQRFEVDSADAASRFLLENDYPKSKAELVWDSIALHTSTGIVDRKQPEVAFVHVGAYADLFGLGLNELTPSLVEDVVALYPRLGLKAAFTEALAEVIRKKPHTAFGTGLVDIGHRHVHGFGCPNLCDLINNAPFES